MRKWTLIIAEDAYFSDDRERVSGKEFSERQGELGKSYSLSLQGVLDAIVASRRGVVSHSFDEMNENAGIPIL